MDLWGFKSEKENSKFGVSIRIELRQVKWEFRTTIVNSIFSCIPDISRELRETKNGKSVKNNQFSAWVTPEGFEPPTVRAEI